MVLGIFKNPCLVPLLLLAISLALKFHFPFTEKSKREVLKKGCTQYNLADGMTVLA